MRHIAMNVKFEGDREQTQHWVSLDGNSWLPIDRAPTSEDTDQDVRAVFEGTSQTGLKPLRFDKQYLNHLIESGNAQVIEGSLSGQGGQTAS